MRITKRLLVKHGACKEQVKKFAKLFPKGVVPTRELCEKYAQEFDFAWGASNLLTENQMAEYEKVEGPARAEYAKVTGLAWVEYEKVRDRAWVEYEKVEGSALAEYKKVVGLARAEYGKARAIAFYRASLI